MMSVTFLLFQCNLYLDLTQGKGPKNGVHRDLFKAKNPKQKNPSPQLRFTCFTVCGQAFSLTDFPKCLKNIVFPKFLVNTLWGLYPISLAHRLIHFPIKSNSVFRTEKMNKLSFGTVKTNQLLVTLIYSVLKVRFKFKYCLELQVAILQTASSEKPLLSQDKNKSKNRAQGIVNTYIYLFKVDKNHNSLLTNKHRQK